MPVVVDERSRVIAKTVYRPPRSATEKYPCLSVAPAQAWGPRTMMIASVPAPVRASLTRPISHPIRCCAGPVRFAPATLPADKSMKLSNTEAATQGAILFSTIGRPGPPFLSSENEHTLARAPGKGVQLIPASNPASLTDSLEAIGQAPWICAPGLLLVSPFRRDQ